MHKFILAAALAALPSLALAAPSDYAVVCSTACNQTVYDSNGNHSTVQEPAGYVTNSILIDPSVAHGFSAGDGTLLIPGGAGLSIGQTATPAQMATGVPVIP